MLVFQHSTVAEFSSTELIQYIPGYTSKRTISSRVVDPGLFFYTYPVTEYETSDLKSDRMRIRRSTVHTSTVSSHPEAQPCILLFIIAHPITVLYLFPQDLKPLVQRSGWRHIWTSHLLLGNNKKKSLKTNGIMATNKTKETTTNTA